METNAKYSLIGFFTLLVFAIAFFMIYWVGRLDHTASARTISVAFPGSIAGLVPGSSVLFNGIRVGTVAAMKLDPTDPQVVIVDMTVSEDTPLKADTEITLGTVGVTGASYVDMRGGSKQAPSLFERDNIPLLQADSSAVNDLLQTAREIMGRADSTFRKIDELVDSNSVAIDKTIKNVAQFSEALASNAGGIDQFLASTSSAAEQIKMLAVQFEGLVAQTDELLNAVQPEQISNIVDNVETFSGKLKDTADNLENLVAEAEQTMKSFGELGQSLKSSLAQLDSMITAVSAEDIAVITSNIRELTNQFSSYKSDIGRILENFRQGSEKLQAFAAQFYDKSQQIDNIVNNAEAISENFRQTSARFDELMDQADNVLGSQNGQGLMVEIKDTLYSFRRAATAFELRLGEIADGLARFSSSGLRDLEGLVSDGRRAVGGLDRVIQQLEKNPARFLSGGSDIPTYRGRPRR